MSPGISARRARLVSISGKYEFTSSIKEARTDDLSNVFDILRAPTSLVSLSSRVKDLLLVPVMITTASICPGIGLKISLYRPRWPDRRGDHKGPSHFTSIRFYHTLDCNSGGQPQRSPLLSKSIVREW